MKSFKLHLEEKRCWPGYKPAPGKEAYSKGSCVKEDVESVSEGVVASLIAKGINKLHSPSVKRAPLAQQSDRRKFELPDGIERPRTQKEDVDLVNESKMKDLALNLKHPDDGGMSHPEFEKHYGKPKSHYMQKPKVPAPQQTKVKEEAECNGTPGDVECPIHGMNKCENIKEDWQKVNKSDNTDGLSQKAVDAYRRENPGSKLKTAVTKDPSKLKAGSKDAKRRLSFCRRMRGMKNRLTNPENARDPDSPVNKALRRWNC